MAVIAGVPREIFPGDRRVALVPAVLPLLTKAGVEVVIEAGADEAAGYPDAAYAEAGARVERARVFGAADAVFQVLCHGANDPTGRADLALLQRGQVLIGFLRLLGSVETVREIAATGVTAFAVEVMPRITRAQSMDALSAMSTVAGYSAVLRAANLLPRMFPMLMTAAGTITPARVLVVGAGVAGLQAIARDETFYRRQRELMARVVATSDVVITTAVVPGRKAPVLVTSDMVRAMAPGSVVVDLAAERGGNCELTRAGETVVEHGVTIVGAINLAGAVPYHASQMCLRPRRRRRAARGAGARRGALRPVHARHGGGGDHWGRHVAKLEELIGGRPLLFPGQGALNGALLLGARWGSAAG